MSLAMKCDRCKKLFEPNIHKKGYAKAYVRLLVNHESPKSVLDTICDYDLCNECAEELEKWIDMENKQKLELEIAKETLEEEFGGTEGGS